jgi:hypothetical protein
MASVVAHDPYNRGMITRQQEVKIAMYSSFAIASRASDEA